MHIRSAAIHPDQYPTDAVYPFNLPVFQAYQRLDLHTPVTFFVGENGAGKSTLLQAIAQRCGIHIWNDPDRKRSVNNPYESQFYRAVSVEWVNGIVPGSFFSSSGYQYFIESVDEWLANDPGQAKYFGGGSLMTRSHGQSLMAFFQARYAIPGLYLLDEPETALSPATQVAFLSLLEQASQAGQAQFIIATHSPIIMALPGAVIYNFDQAPIQPIRYEDTDHYRVYQRFLEDRNQYFKSAG